ncbi:MAG: peptidase C14 [Benniella sp.]|nr:MAG: peptidase C14 [Benniella sp.]
MPAPPTRAARKKALLIGINYFGDPNQLLGCINDTRELFGFISGYFGFMYHDTIMLTDDSIYEDKRPTGANIRYWMKWLIKDAQPQDSLFFHYAGNSEHCKLLVLGDEADGFDEIIYPCDYLRSGIISDDEMYDLMVKDLPAGVQLTALVDACHSGTMLDLPYVYNGDHVTALEKISMPRKKMGAMAAMSADESTNIPIPGSISGANVQTTTTTTTTTITTVVGPNGVTQQYTNTNGIMTTKTKGNVVMFSGCRDDQALPQTYLSPQARGAVSYAWIKSLSLKRDQTYEELLLSMRNFMKQRDLEQVPQLGSGRPMDMRATFRL